MADPTPTASTSTGPAPTGAPTPTSAGTASPSNTVDGFPGPCDPGPCDEYIDTSSPCIHMDTMKKISIEFNNALSTLGGPYPVYTHLTRDRSTLLQICIGNPCPLKNAMERVQRDNEAYHAEQLGHLLTKITELAHMIQRIKELCRDTSWMKPDSDLAAGIQPILTDNNNEDIHNCITGVSQALNVINTFKR